MINPRMVTIAREAAGLTQTALAHAVGISQAQISQIEHGVETGSLDVFAKMARELDVTPEFFEQDYTPIGEGIYDFFHRRRQTLPAKPLKRAHAFANLVRFETLQLLRTVEMTDVAPLPFFSSEDYSPAAAAQAVRATWRIPSGPLPDLVALVEAAAVPVFRWPMFHEKLGALSLPGVDGRRPMIFLNGLMSASNLRFGLAHELGHLVMHNGVGRPDLESEADQFAAELLMPAGDILPELRNIRFNQLGGIKMRWHVSLAAAIRRTYDLGVVSERQYRYFNMQLNKLPDGRKKEPGEFAYEEPRLIRSVIDHLLQDFGYTIEGIATLMRTDVATVEHRYLGAPARASIRSVGRGENVYQFPIRSVT